MSDDKMTEADLDDMEAEHEKAEAIRASLAEKSARPPKHTRDPIRSPDETCAATPVMDTALNDDMIESGRNLRPEERRRLGDAEESARRRE